MKLHAKQLTLILTAALTQIGCSGPNRAQTYNPYLNTSAQQQNLSQVGNSFANTAGYNPQQQQAGWGNSPMARQALTALSGQVDTDHDGIPDSQDRCPTDPLNKCAATSINPNNNNNDDANANSNAQANQVHNFVVDRSDELRVETQCSTMKAVRKDLDGDKVMDYCEDNIDLLGLDKNVYNGFAIGARTFTLEKTFLSRNKPTIGDATSLQLSDKEKDAYKKSKYKDLVGLDPNEGSNDKLDKLITLKYFARVVANQTIKASGADQKAIQDVFGINQAHGGLGIIPINMQNRANTILKMPSLSENLGLVTGVGIEAVPFSMEGAKSVSELTGIEPQTANVPQDSGFLYIAETHVVIPSTSTQGLKIKVGNLVAGNDNASAGSKAGMFFVFVNNGSQIITSNVISNKTTGTSMLRTAGNIQAVPGCSTAHMVIAFFSDKKMDPNINLFSENVFYSESGSDKWKPFSQDMLRIQPLKANADEDCTFKKEDVFFTPLADLMSTAVLPPTEQSGDQTKSTSMNTPTVDQQIAGIQGEIRDLSKSATFDADKSKITAELDALDATGLSSDNDSKLHEMRTVLARVTPISNTTTTVGPK